MICRREKQTKNPFRNERTHFYTLYREYRSASCGASFSVSRRKLLDREWLRYFVPSRWLHPLAPLKRLSSVDLSSVNGFGKPFTASKFED